MNPNMTRDILQTLTQSEVMTLDRMRLRSGWDIKQRDIEYMMRERLVKESGNEGVITYRITDYGKRMFNMLSSSLDREAKGR